ncbi:conserved oligomeric Golgi complex subunit 7 isoform X2 [Agrilus planipennis]|nr:conserved oligomeric Golgi complex subunit 7 isoform X2 [Agrilus planipennis]
MSLVMKLQLYVQQINSVLEQTSEQILTSLPKIMRDTKNLQEEALILREKMESVKEEIFKVEQDTGPSLQSIEKLDRLKSQLEIAKQSLHESDNWTMLVNDLEELFDSKNIEVIATKLLSMQQSLKLLINAPDYEDRKLQLEGLKNRLEAITSPMIVQTFTTNNIEQAISYAQIFESINRMPQLIKYYHNCHKELLLKKWRDQLEVEQDEQICQCIHNYLDFLLSHWHSQAKWFSQVFPHNSALDALTDTYVSALSGLDPSIGDCIEAALKQTTEKLNLLNDVKQILKQFATNITALVETSTQGKIDKQKHLPLLQVIYSPLVNFVSKYAAYEQAFLLQKLSNINYVKDDLNDTVKSLNFTIPQIVDLARDAKKRCHDITENCGLCGLLIAIRALFINFADYFRVVLRQIERSRTHKEEWNVFQLCLTHLESTGDVLLKIQQLEKDLTRTVLDVNENDVEIQYKYLLLNSVDRKEFESLIRCVTDGTQLFLLDYVTSEFSKLCADIHRTLYQVVLEPIVGHLDVAKKPEAWANVNDLVFNNDLPDYSFSPQEYITQIGLYLMTLPQHLEPFFFRENPSLWTALKAADERYNVAGEDVVLADIFLRIIATSVCQSFSDRILSIRELNQMASRQLSHDIGYLANVLEDLGVSVTEDLKQLSNLLKLPSDVYQTQSSGYMAKYVAAVRQMRNITST